MSFNIVLIIATSLSEKKFLCKKNNMTSITAAIILQIESQFSISDYRKSKTKEIRNSIIFIETISSYLIQSGLQYFNLNESF